MARSSRIITAPPPCASHRRGAGGYPPLGTCSGSRGSNGRPFLSHARTNMLDRGATRRTRNAAGLPRRCPERTGVGESFAASLLRHLRNAIDSEFGRRCLSGTAARESLPAHVEARFEGPPLLRGNRHGIQAVVIQPLLAGPYAGNPTRPHPPPAPFNSASPQAYA